MNRIPLTVVDVADAEPLVAEVLRSGSLVQGPMVERLERGFAEVAGTAHAVAVNSGTTAIVAALRVLNLAPGDEVITSPFTFAGTVNAILEAGASVRFADISTDFTLDPDRVADAVTARTRVLMPVQLYGLAAAMAPLAELADRHGLAMVEDAAQAAGASCDGKPAGSFGIGCFSLYATKNVTAAEGGMITTDSGKVADRLRVLRNQGMRTRYDHVAAGHNYRMSDVHAAIGVAQLARLPEIASRRAHNADRLTAGLAGCPGLALPAVPPGRVSAWHQFTVRVRPGARLSRDDLAKALAARGIDTGVYYPRVVFDYDCYRAHPRVHAVPLAEVPVAAAAAREVLALPVHHRLTDEQAETVVAAVREELGG